MRSEITAVYFDKSRFRETKEVSKRGRKMKYCHGCLKRIWFWESRAERRHIKCLPIEERCKYYHIQRDITMSAFIAVILSVIISISLINVIKSIECITIGYWYYCLCLLY